MIPRIAEPVFALEFRQSLWDDARQVNRNRIEKSLYNSNPEGVL